MKSPKVSIVSITYNHEKYIRETLESFVSQKTDFDFEVIIADDCSTDKTRDIIDEYKRAYPHVFKAIYRKNNVGVHRNLIGALEEASGEYIALCEGDDFWTDKDKLQKQVDFLDANHDYVICFHPTRVFYENRSAKEAIWPLLNRKSKITVEELLRENFIPTNAVMYRRQSYEHIPTNVMPLDWYIHLYHAQFGKIGFIDKTMSAYRRHDAGIWSDSFLDPDSLWKKYGISQVAMFVELLNIFGKNEGHKEIIYTSLTGVLNRLLEVDEKYRSDLLPKALHEFPQALGIFMATQHQDFQNINELVQNKNQHIDELNKEIVSLRDQVFQLKGDLYQLRHMLVIGELIRTRAFLGRIRRSSKGQFGRILGETREFIRKILPRPVRILVKRVYKYDYRAKLSTVKTFTNRPWTVGAPLVSVVIPYYNRVDTIDDTLNSLYAQTFKNFEIILVDDGSTETHSIQRLTDLEKSGSAVRIIRQANQGVSTARNIGIKQAKGKYIICLDSDDMLDPTYIEKCTVMLETAPDIALVTTHQDMFGVTSEVFVKSPYDPMKLYGVDNMVITAAEFRREAWRVSGGYRPGIGYEDWEFWINLSENGFWGRLLPEPLFKYRTSMQSRYVDDKGGMHWKNIQMIRSLHPKYKMRVKKLIAKRQYLKYATDPKFALVNMDRPDDYLAEHNGRPNILITIPWMTFGGAETLIYNYCREIKDRFDISFITGLKSEHEWEYKFREISPRLYHLANLFSDSALYLEFISNYIKTRHINVLHIIHNGFTFDMLPELTRRFPNLKVVVTLFNDRVEYFQQSVDAQQYIDAFSTDNMAVAEHFRRELPTDSAISAIPNGIDCFDEYNPKIFSRKQERADLGIESDELAVFFVGRLSEEKNPDVFIGAARAALIESKKLKFFVIGDGKMRGEIEKLIKDSATKHIKYLGYQSEVAKYLSAADIFVLPSSIEGFPLSILEAMSMGVAVIASRVGAVPDVIETGKNGFVVTPGSEEEIAQTILELHRKPKLLSEVKTAARASAEQKYSTTALGENYRKLYSQVINGDN